jgi:uncharacterized protein
MNEHVIDVASSRFTTNRLRPIVDILVTAAPLVLAGYIGTIIGTDTLLGGMLVTLGYMLSILIGGYVLRSRKTGWVEIGFMRPQSWLRTVLLGLLALLGVVLASTLVQGVIPNLLRLKIAPIDQSRFDPLIGDLPTLIFGVVLAWTTIGFGEEMLFRAFLINRFGKVFEGFRGRTVLAVIFSAILFGMAHYMAEGLLGAVSTTIMGLVLGIFYVRCRGNLWVTIIAHGLANSIRFVLLFLGQV